MGTYTEKFNLYKPAVGETGWGTLVSENFQIISELTAEDWGAQPTLTFDTTPTAGSSNPVTSNGIKVAIDAKQDILSGVSGSVATYTTTAGTLTETEIISTPTSGNNGLVTSDGIFNAVSAKQNTIPAGTTGNVVTYTGTAGTVGELAVNDAPASGNTGLVTSNGIYTAVNAKQSKIPAGTSGDVVTYSGTAGTVGSLGFDSAVTSASTNLVKSGVVYTAIEAKPTILKGTSEPTSEQGKDGDIYIYYTEE